MFFYLKVQIYKNCRILLGSNNSIFGVDLITGVAKQIKTKLFAKYQLGVLPTFVAFFLTLI